MRLDVSGSAAALGLAVILAACDKPPTRPSPGPTAPEPPRPDVPVPVSFTRLELDGPASVPPGETAQFTATAFYSDGSSRDVSGEAAWQAGLPLSISTTGLASGHSPGENYILVVFSGRSATKKVMVIKPGTYRISGAVRDAGLLVYGAEVAVSAGPAEGLSTIAVAAYYHLYGVFGETEIRVRRPGYQEQKQRIVVTAHQNLDFSLALSTPRDQVNGTWTVTITAADECRAKLPDEAMERRYRAVLRQDGAQQDGPRVTATLEGGTVYSANQRFTFQGRAEPDRLTFWLAGATPYEPYYSDFNPGDVFEQLSADPVFLSAGGSVVLSASGDRRSGSLVGVVATFGGPPGYPLLRSCDSSRHRFELTR